MSDNSKLDEKYEYFFGELKKIELTEDDTSGVFSYIAAPSPGFAPLGYPLGPVPRTPVMVAPSFPVGIRFPSGPVTPAVYY
jgi:hypothetical protein